MFITSLLSAFLLTALPTQEAALESEKSPSITEISHAFGYFAAKNLIRSELTPLDIESVIQGIRDQHAGRPISISEERYERALADLHDVAYKNLAEKNKKVAQAFLAKKGHETSVCSLASGRIQFTIEKVGSGPSVQEHATPLVHFTASHQNGSIFNSSHNEGPVPLNLDETYPSLARAVVGMKENEERRIYLHPDEVPGLGNESHPGSLVIFDIEVVKVEAPLNHDLMNEKAGIEGKLEKALAIQ